MWIVCQIGAREHYAIPRALQRGGELAGLVTDFWVPPGSAFGRLPGGRRLKDRFHDELANARVFSSNGRMLGFELRQRLLKRSGWPVMMERNRLFQQHALACFEKLESQEQETKNKEPRTLFSYSYAARDLFRWAKQRGWTTVLGQIDPGPEEERIVAEEHRRYPNLGSRWQPAPASYWETWREELELADVVVVNSDWSRDCLLKGGVPAGKIRVIPLVYEEGQSSAGKDREEQAADPPAKRPVNVLFLGQINLRKGGGRLLDAMRLLRDEPVELTLVGPAEIDPSAWADLPKVRWMGPVPRSEVARFYQEADVFILPTLSDGYALTQLEALSQGLPVIASRCCGAAVEHGRNGWVLEDVEPATLSRTLLHAMERLKDVECTKMPGDGMAGLRVALETIGNE